MHFIFESLFVGIYVAILHEILVNFIDNYFVLLFVLGFVNCTFKSPENRAILSGMEPLLCAFFRRERKDVKRYLGYELSFHTFFCKYGYACQRVVDSQNMVARIDMKNLLLECFMEGCAFIILGYFLLLVSNDRLLIAFFIGIILHNGAEIFGIHKNFCRRCVPDLRAPEFEPLMFQEK